MSTQQQQPALQQQPQQNKLPTPQSKPNEINQPYQTIQNDSNIKTRNSFHSSTSKNKQSSYVPNKRLYQSVDDTIKEYYEKKEIQRLQASQYSPTNTLGGNNFESTSVISSKKKLLTTLKRDPSTLSVYSDNLASMSVMSDQALLSEEHALLKKEKRELDKLKRQFARELKFLIESEVKKQKEEQKKEEKVVNYYKKVQQLDEERKIIEATKQAHSTMSRRESLKSLLPSESLKELDNLEVGLNESRMSFNKQFSEGNKRRQETLMRLMQKNEEKTIKHELAKTMREEEDESRREKMMQTFQKTEQKLNLHLDMKKVEIQKKQEDNFKRKEYQQSKLEQITQRDEIKKEMIMTKIQIDTERTRELNQQKMAELAAKQEAEKQKLEKYNERYSILNEIKDSKNNETLQKHMMKRERSDSIQRLRAEIGQAKQSITRDFMEKKNMIIQKLAELKKNNRNIEEIYKYTTDIIFEEEGEDEDDAYGMSTMKKVNKSVLKQSEGMEPTLTQRSRSQNQINRTGQSLQPVKQEEISQPTISQKINKQSVKTIDVDDQSPSRNLDNSFEINLQGNQGKTNSGNRGAPTHDPYQIYNTTKKQSGLPEIPSNKKAPQLNRNADIGSNSASKYNQRPSGVNQTIDYSLDKSQKGDLLPPRYGNARPRKHPGFGNLEQLYHNGSRNQNGATSATRFNNNKSSMLNDSGLYLPTSVNQSYDYGQKPERQRSLKNNNSGDNSFLIDLTRKRQKEEILQLIRDEEIVERERIATIKDPSRANDREKLEAQFKMERRQAQQRIQMMIKRHEDQIQELMGSSDNLVGGSQQYGKGQLKQMGNSGLESSTPTNNNRGMNMRPKQNVRSNNAVYI